MQPKEPKKRKRGRPKGSKNKPQYNTYGRDYIDPDEIAALKPIADHEDEFALEEEENDENASPVKKEMKGNFTYDVNKSLKIFFSLLPYSLTTPLIICL